MKRHLIGIGGVGMSALATALVRLGDEVTGADRTLGTPNIRFLEGLGVKVFPDDGSGVDEATDEIIVSTAIERDNPGLIKAQQMGIPVTHRAKALARTLSNYKLIAVVGTCGKSTVTAMLGHILTECGFDPMCVNGANVPGWEGAVRFGRGKYAVAEVDESDKSLVAFSPYAAIVTNASADHYSEAEMNEVFDAFIKTCEGPVVDARGEVYRPQDFNRQNASLAVRMAIQLGCKRADAEKAMESFGGVERRLQRYGSRVYDDYAHNPEKLRSMWLTLAEQHPKGICVIWRPHGYAPLRKMLEALATMFNEVVRPCDRLLLLPVYDAGGTTDRSINSSALAAKLTITFDLVDDLDRAYARCVELSNTYEAIVTCGARDPGLPRLAARLAERFAANYPLQFAIDHHAALWGGERWLVSAHESSPSIVANGALKGKRLNELLPEYPLLLKVIEAKTRLSVQVHPNERTAKLMGGEPKTEMWCLLNDGFIYAGLKAGVGPAEVEQAVITGSFEELLVRHEAKRGEVFFIPGGMVHAIGDGTRIFEVQQSSNTTYRLYDWNRVGTDGKPRELHIAQSLQAIDYTLLPAQSVRSVDCEFFSFHKLCIDGTQILRAEKSPLAIFDVAKEEAILLPVGVEVTLSGSKAEFFVVRGFFTN